MDATAQLTMLGRAALATVLTFAIGLEREYRGKSAGERTFALLGLGAASFTASAALFLGVDGAGRVIQGVVAGMGFLGAGVIFRRPELDVQGLTTAAGAWSAAAIGVVIGLGGYLAGALVTGLVLVILELGQIPVLRKAREVTPDPSPPPPEGDA
ncbi:MAG TPA: MgtC/SapB family protein [Actinomycetota bacterium]|jgi:putative Mg2+ transporter-C (MgtC) family protein|nr:MgtC/SapB family protein [Actinomycetota bacterium]